MSRCPPIKIRGRQLQNRIARSMFFCGNKECKANLGVRHPANLAVPPIIRCPECNGMASLVKGLDEREIKAKFVFVRQGAYAVMKRLEVVENVG